ncbi:MAG: hypothetical protein FWF86_01925 [Clostridia bacterium]|nr:hypothetical protein [Clostridia bacterium]
MIRVIRYYQRRSLFTKALDAAIAATAAVLLLFMLARWFPFPLLNGMFPKNSPVKIAGIGLLANGILIRLVVSTFQALDIRFSRFHALVFLCAAGVSLGIYAYLVMTRQFLYYWDFTNYYEKALRLIRDAKKFSVLRIFADVYQSVLDGEYSDFIALFTIVPFCWTDLSCDSYLLGYGAFYLPVLYAVGGGVLCQLWGRVSAEKGKWFFALGMGTMVCFPLLHAAALNAMPDYFGVVFILLIILLTMNETFEKRAYGRWALLLASVFSLIAARRWYLFWMAAYAAIFGVYSVLSIGFSRQRGRIRKRYLTLLTMGGFCALFVGVLLFPMIIRVLREDYTRRYASYLGGGFTGELLAQVSRLGWMFAAMVLVGMVYGLFQRKYRGVAICQLAAWTGGLFLFTRIQNMGFHQALLLVPGYLLWVWFFLSACARLRWKALRIAAAFAVGIALLWNGYAAVFGMEAAAGVKPLWSGIRWHAPSRRDKGDVLAMAEWIEEKAKDGEIFYMIPHNVTYNPSMFRDILMPSLWLRNGGALHYGYGVLSNHFFPAAMFRADCVITCDPLTSTGLDAKLNKVFLENGCLETRFECVKTWDTAIGYAFYAYKRIYPYDRMEVMTYYDAFAEERERFPELYDGPFTELFDGC